MGDELQHIIERIQQDGIAKAEAESQRILREAHERAAAIMREAETQAQARVAQAEEDARQFAGRADKSLEQAARDLVLTVHEAIGASFQLLVDAGVRESLSEDVVRQMLVRLVETYWERQGNCADLDLMVTPADHKAIVDYFLQKHREALDRGVQIHADNGIVRGFRVSMDGAHVYHDFTQSAIAEALGRLLRPRLAAIVKRAVEHV